MSLNHLNWARRRRSSRKADHTAANGGITPRVRTLLGGGLLALTVAIAATAVSAPPGPTAAPAGQLRVKVTLVGGEGAKHPAADAVVWLPGASVSDSDATTGTVRIAQRHKAFEPHVEAVPAGSTVEFPNFDRIYHNVFSLSEIARFDLGLYRNGASRSVTFGKPGVIRIYCNIHPLMSAFLVVVEGRAYAKTGPDGSALLPPVAPGAYRMSVWHERVGERTVNVVVKPGAVTPVEVPLDASRWRPEAHKNKYGKDYPPPDDDETRY